MKLAALRQEQVPNQVTEDGLTMTARQTARYLEMSPYFHDRGCSHHPPTTGIVELLIRTIMAP
jgi:hypothetical protein